MGVCGETWGEWVRSWAKVWAVFFGLWLVAGLGAVLWWLGRRLPDYETETDAEWNARQW